MPTPKPKEPRGTDTASLMKSLLVAWLDVLQKMFPRKIHITTLMELNPQRVRNKREPTFTFN